MHFPVQCIIVYSMYRHTVLPSSIDIHLRNKNKHNILQDKQICIIQHIQAIKDLVTSRAELNRLVFLLANSPPISELQPLRTDGMQCEFEDDNSRSCRFISCHEDQIRKHCREEHGWENKQKGRPKAGTEKRFPWRSGVHCQHFFVRGPGVQFFEIQVVESSPVMLSGDIDLDAAKTALK